MSTLTTNRPNQETGRVAIGVVGVMSFSVAREMLSALRQVCPSVPVYFPVFSTQEPKDDLEDLLFDLSIESVNLTGAYSVSAARNALVTSISESFILIVPAGWIPNQPFDEEYLHSLCDLVERNEDWLLVAGTANKSNYSHLNVLREKMRPGNAELVQSRLTEIVYLGSEPTEVIQSDLVTDFFLLSNSRLASMQIQWDEQMEGMEHEDFCFQLMKWREKEGGGKVFFLPEFIATPAPSLAHDEKILADVANEALISFARKWQVNRFEITSGRKRRNTVWLERDFLWVKALAALIEGLDRTGLKWHLCGSSNEGAVQIGNFLPEASEIEVQVLSSRTHLSALWKALRKSGFTLREAQGNPLEAIMWQLDYPTPPEDEWRFGPVVVMLSIKIRETSVDGRALQKEPSEGFLDTDQNLEEIFVDSWGLAVKVVANASRKNATLRSVSGGQLLEKSAGPGREEAAGRWHGRLIEWAYRVGLHLRFSNIRFFRLRHPRFNLLFEFPLKVYRFVRRRVVERLERIDLPSFRGLFWSVRYRFRKWMTITPVPAHFPLDDFEIRWINLPERKLRSQRLMGEFERLGFVNHRRFEAVYRSPGILGCAISHLEVLREEISSDPAVIVCEDDVEFLVSREKIQEIFDEFMSNPTLDVLCLGYNAFGPRINISDSLQICKKINTTSLYVAKKQAIRHLMHCFSDSERHLINGDPEWIYAPDQLWTRLQEGKLIFAIPRFQVLRQRPDYSSIERASVNYGV